MTSTNNGSEIGGYRSEVDQQKLGPALTITAGIILGMRTARWPPTHSDGLENPEWEKEVEHSVRVAKRVLSYVMCRYPDLFHSKQVLLDVVKPQRFRVQPSPARILSSCKRSSFGAF
jgi:hypothetical protein